MGSKKELTICMIEKNYLQQEISYKLIDSLLTLERGLWWKEKREEKANQKPWWEQNFQLMLYSTSMHAHFYICYVCRIELFISILKPSWNRTWKHFIALTFLFSSWEIINSSTTGKYRIFLHYVHLILTFSNSSYNVRNMHCCCFF